MHRHICNCCKVFKTIEKKSFKFREHINLIDVDRFLELGQEYYAKMKDDKKAL
jgi:hypothetical protein